MADQGKLIHPDERDLLRRVCVCPIPDDTTANYSMTVTGLSADDATIVVQKTMGTITYERTITISSGTLTATVWSQV